MWRLTRGRGVQSRQLGLVLARRDALLQLGERHEHGLREPAGRVLPRFAHVEELRLTRRKLLAHLDQVGGHRARRLADGPRAAHCYVRRRAVSHRSAALAKGQRRQGRSVHGRLGLKPLHSPLFTTFSPFLLGGGG